MTDDIKHEPSDDSRITRLSTFAPMQTEGEEVASSEEVVREYEARYSPIGDTARKVKAMPRSYSTSHVSEDERLWAAAAHASAWVTLLGGIFSIGAIVPVSIFIPLAIFFLFRKRSDFVAFHALQAFVLQLVGTVGAFALLTIGGTVWLLGMIVSALLVLLLIGVVLVPLWGIVGIALVLAVLALPIVMVFYGTVAAYNTYRGEDYRYPFVAYWVDRQLAGGLLNTA
jgi:uncharacterized Tic20 family protein